MSRGEREIEHRLLGGIGLLIGRRARHVGRQLSAGFGNGRLDVLRGGVDVAVERELDRDVVEPLRVGRAHRLYAGDGRELPLERRRHRRTPSSPGWPREARRSPGWSGNRRWAGPRRAARESPRSRNSRIANVISAVITGRSMKRRETFMFRAPARRLSGPERPRSVAPGNSRSWPSVTTVSPGSTPFSMTTFPLDRRRRRPHSAARRSYRLHYVNELSLLPGLHGFGGHHGGVAGVEGQRHVRRTGPATAGARRYRRSP